MTRLLPFRQQGTNWPCSCISMTFSLASGGAGGPMAGQWGRARRLAMPGESALRATHIAADRKQIPLERHTYKRHGSPWQAALGFRNVVCAMSTYGTVQWRPTGECRLSTGVEEHAAQPRWALFWFVGSKMSSIHGS